MSEVRPRKKSLWKILNTPVQELFKEEGWLEPTVATESDPETISVEPQPGSSAEPALSSGLADLEEQASPVTTQEVAIQAMKTPAVKLESEQDTAQIQEPLPMDEVAEEEEEEASAATTSLSTAEPPAQESDWFKSFKDMFWLGLGNRDKQRWSSQQKQSWLARFRERLSKSRKQLLENIHRLAKGRTKVDEDMLEELEEILLQSDVGIATTDRILDYLRTEAKKRRFLPEEVLPSLMNYLEQELIAEPFRIETGRLNIFLIVGVNGTGKTTTIGKMAAKLKIAGYKVMLAAGDTFRAAAIEQLSVWGQRVGCPVIRHHEGADAAAVVFDAIQSARARQVDVLLIDTAGRLHNKDHLMEELKKVYRIIEREKGDARLESLLVLDATTGQNGLRQAEVFSKAIPLTGLILTKLDGTAKGGVIFAIRQALNIPICLVGVGEHLEDLQEFEPRAYVHALFSDSEFMSEDEG